MKEIIFAYFGIVIQILLLTAKVNADCQGSVTTLTNSSGTFTSPGYPNSYYGNNLTCKWNISLPAEKYPALIITDLFFEDDLFLECVYDYIQFSADGLVIDTICGQPSSLPISITSFTNFIEVLFKTDNDRVERGFTIAWVTSTEPGDYPTTTLAPTTETPPNEDLYYLLFLLLLLLPIFYVLLKKHEENKVAAAKAKEKAEAEARAAAKRKKDAEKPKKKTVRTKHPAKSHIAMICPRGTRKNANALNKFLETENFKIVVSNNKQGSMKEVEDIANLIKSAECVIALLTATFEDDETCTKEIEFADKCKKTIIPVIAEEDFEFGDGWLGLLLGGDTAYELFSQSAAKRTKAKANLIEALEKAAPNAKHTFTEKIVDCENEEV